MSLSGLLRTALAEPSLAALVSASTPGGPQELDVVASAGVRPLALAGLARPREDGAGGRPILAVTASGRDAEDLAAAVRDFLDPVTVAEFPAWETLPHERLSPRNDTVGRRLSVLRRLAHPGPAGTPSGPISVVVAPVRAVLQPVVRGLGDLEPVTARPGAEYPLEELVEALVAAAYQRVDMVERRGEFAVRGGILDVFPPTEEHPVRLEFFGDLVEEARWFSVADQRSLEPAEAGLWAPPCREVLLTDDVRKRAADLVPHLPGVADLLEKVAAGIAVEGMESLAPALVDGMESLVDLVPDDALVVVVDPERVRARAHDLIATDAEFLAASWANAAAGNAVPIDLTATAEAGLIAEGSFRTLADTRARAVGAGLGWWRLTPFEPGDAEDVAGDDGALTIATTDVPTSRGAVDAAVAAVRERVAAGWAVVATTEGSGSAQRLVEMLAAADVPARRVAGLADKPEAGVVHVTTAAARHGFLAPAHHLALVTEADLTGQRGSRDVHRLPSRRRNAVDPLQLRPGDHVVHEQHGVGKYVEMVQRTVAGATREYLVIEYAPSRRGQPGDRLYVPSDALDQVTRYVGGDQPALNKMGGSDWAKTKGRARKAVREIAADLIRLYSARMASTGFAFSSDTPWQRELEDAFAYVETPDQLSCIDEVKADMEKQIPMDRLVCGDVGYGKTEIAVRAAFKAVQDGKQAAVLVPTTLLVQQHMETFAQRYGSFPVVVRPLSRFSTPSEADAVKAGLADGSVDVVIGTHRLISGEVRFRDLGLIVVDEEQRFGVEHKEKLKQLRTNVDVLAMSATPIPRTLEMGVTGIREMSTLATPPEERHPVLTFVGAYQERQIAAAIRRELLRDGQVFFIHNRVESIDRAARRVGELVPEARVAVAHGRLGEHRLEEVIVDFWNRRFDVLVCTTIVETGLDISNANTLIVERADLLGLAQLHQLRGRVGRGRERAYAYFLFPPERPITETAHDRLETIAAHTDLGAGMHVAMKDLEIRGAGNLLGGEQSGHIAGVGFDLYVRLVGEAVAEFRGQGGEDAGHAEVKIELPVDAHLPHDYVPGERLRLEAYRKIAEIDAEERIVAVRDELTDRYGTPPQPVLNLLEVARLRVRARRAGLSEIAAAGNHIRFGPIDLPDSARLRLQRLYPRSLVKPAARAVLVPKPGTAGSPRARLGQPAVRDGDLLVWAREVIDAMAPPPSPSPS